MKTSCQLHDIFYHMWDWATGRRNHWEHILHYDFYQTLFTMTEGLFAKLYQIGSEVIYPVVPHMLNGVWDVVPHT